jgi:hypothetical protein
MCRLTLLAGPGQTKVDAAAGGLQSVRFPWGVAYLNPSSIKTRLVPAAEPPALADPFAAGFSSATRHPGSIEHPPGEYPPLARPREATGWVCAKNLDPRFNRCSVPELFLETAVARTAQLNQTHEPWEFPSLGIASFDTAFYYKVHPCYVDFL